MNKKLVILILTSLIILFYLFLKKKEPFISIPLWYFSLDINDKNDKKQLSNVIRKIILDNNVYTFDQLLDMFGFNKDNLIIGVAVRENDLKNPALMKKALNTFEYFNPAVFNRHSKIMPNNLYDIDNITGKYKYNFDDFKFNSEGIDNNNLYLDFLNKTNSKGAFKYSLSPQSSFGIRRDYVSCSTFNCKKKMERSYNKNKENCNKQLMSQGYKEKEKNRRLNLRYPNKLPTKYESNVQMSKDLKIYTTKIISLLKDYKSRNIDTIEVINESCASLNQKNYDGSWWNGPKPHIPKTIDPCSNPIKKDYCNLTSGWENPWLALGFDKYLKNDKTEEQLKNMGGWKDYSLRKPPIKRNEIRHKLNKKYIKHRLDPKEWNTEKYLHPYYITKYVHDLTEAADKDDNVKNKTFMYNTWGSPYFDQPWNEKNKGKKYSTKEWYSKWDCVMNSILYLKYRQGYKIDALGFQMHLNNTTEWGGSEGELENFDSYLVYIRALMYWCYSHDLEFHITEFDIPLAKSVGCLSKPIRLDKELNKVQTLIATKFMSLLLRINLDLPKLKVKVINWNLSDINKLQTGYGTTGVFDIDGNPKDFIKAMKITIIAKAIDLKNNINFNYCSDKEEDNNECSLIQDMKLGKKAKNFKDLYKRKCIKDFNNEQKCLKTCQLCWLPKKKPS